MSMRWLMMGVLFSTLSIQALMVKDAGIRCPTEQNLTVRKVAGWLAATTNEIEKVMKVRHLSLKDLCIMPKAKLQRAFEKAAHPTRPDHPGEAARFRMMQESVAGKVAPDGLLRAIRQRKEILERTWRNRIPLLSSQTGSTATATSTDQQEAAGGAAPSGAGIDAQRWQNLGPGNVGGRMRSLWVSPADSDYLLAGSVGGGIWRSSNAGGHWEPVDDFMGSLAVSSIAADPRTTNDRDATVLYAATGEGYYNIDALRGYGLFRSTDGGTSWEHVDSTDPANDSDWYYINRVAVSLEGTIIAVARGNAIFVSDDNASTWTKHTPSVSDTYNMRFQVLFDPNDPAKAIVTGDGGNVFVTSDRGANWTTVHITDTSGFNGRVEVAYAAKTPNLLYASVQKNSGEVYKSVDGGLTWEYLSNPQHLGGQGWYNNTIWVDPTDSNHLVVGGLDLYRSTDGGENWTKISTWWRAPSSPHADHHFLVSDPADAKKLYDTNDGGIYRADDISQADDGSGDNGWTNLNNDLAVTQFYGGAGQAGSSIVGGTQDNGDLLHTGGENNWTAVYGGDGGFSAVADGNDAGKYFYFGEYVYLKIHRSDNGQAAVKIYDDLDDANNNNANFIAPFTLDSNNPDVLLGGGASLWRSTNARASASDVAWEAIRGDIGSRVSQIAIAQGDSDLVLVGYNNGEIYKSTDATSDTPTWTKIHDATNKMVLALMIDKDHHDTFYAGWGGYASDNLERSTDAGASWKDISQGLPQSPMRSIVRNPYHADYLYVGTDVGVFTSEDGGESWQTDNDGPANVSVDKLFWYDEETLVAMTHGRGAFEIKYIPKPCEDVYKALKAYHWTLVSFPCDTADNGIGDLLGGALGKYGENWVMYEQTGADDYNGSKNTQKRQLDLNDTLVIGRGYWVITDADRDMEINTSLPNLAYTPVQNKANLGIVNDNFDDVNVSRLPDSWTTDPKKLMLGNPFPKKFLLSNAYFSHAGADFTALDDNSTGQQDFFDPVVYTYDSAGTDMSNYEAITAGTPGFGDQIDPMLGFFFKLKKAPDTGSNRLAIPLESE